MSRFPNEEWDLRDGNGTIGTWERVAIAVLMDIRQEMRNFNSLLRCPNFRRIPDDLRRIAGNTSKRRKKAKLRATA